MSNPNGYPATLVHEQGNTAALRHGFYSERALVSRAAKIADGLMELPHVQPLDMLAAQEIGSLIARLEAIDRDLDERGHFRPEPGEEPARPQAEAQSATARLAP